MPDQPAKNRLVVLCGRRATTRNPPTGRQSSPAIRRAIPEILVGAAPPPIRIKIDWFAAAYFGVGTENGCHSFPGRSTAPFHPNGPSVPLLALVRASRRTEARCTSHRIRHYLVSTMQTP